MSDFTEQEFNEGMADLMDVHVSWGISRGRILNMVIAGHWEYGSFTPYSDLNQLMPIAWKQEIMLNFNMDECWKAVAYHDDDPSILTAEGYDADPVEAIRQCLWQIYKAKK